MSMAIETCELNKIQIYIKPHPILNIEEIISKKNIPINNYI